IRPTVSKKEFARIKKQQTDMFDVSFGELNFQKLNRPKLLKEGAIYADALTISDAVISDLMDRNMPPNTKSKYGKFPQQLLLKQKFPINIPTVRVINATGSYTEISNVTKKSGTLLFTHINGTVQNLTNDSAAIQK